MLCWQRWKYVMNQTQREFTHLTANVPSSAAMPGTQVFNGQVEDGRRVGRIGRKIMTKM